MADTTEKKTYLVNIESNIKKYAEEAAVAAVEIDKLTEANKKLVAEGKKNTAEYQANLGQIKALRQEQTRSVATIAQLNLALKAETASRKQLGEIQKILRTEMGAMANAMIKDEQGILRVNPLLIEKAKLLKDVTDKIQKYDKAIGDGRSSVGLYSEALEGVLGKLSALPGPAGRAASAVSAFGTQLKALLLNPIMLAISGIVAGLALLGKF
jgi:chromosome segregation ATPase